MKNKILNYFDGIANKIILPTYQVNNIATLLNIILPKDFFDLNSIHRYDYLGNFEFYNWETKYGGNVCDETQFWRDHYNLPLEYVVLSMMDVSAVIMKTISAQKSQVIYCDILDVINMCEGKHMINDPTIFESFTDFYEFLIDEEEKERSEDINS